jgi:hypothetical protein
MKKIIPFLLLGFFFMQMTPVLLGQTCLDRNAKLVKANHNIGLTNPLFPQNCLSCDPNMVNTKGGAFSFHFTNPNGGSGYKGYPSGTIGGFKTGGTYYPGVASTCGMPVINLLINLLIRPRFLYP